MWRDIAASPHAESTASSSQALRVNAAAAVGLQQVMQTNLGPTGTLKLLVGGTLSQLKLTKDGVTLLKEMQIRHPTAALLARTATAQDDICGDGTTSTVLLTGELLRLAETACLSEGFHPRHLTTGWEVARQATLEFLSKHFAVPAQRAQWLQVAQTSLGTKLFHDPTWVTPLSQAVVEAMEIISGQPAAAPATDKGEPDSLLPPTTTSIDRPEQPLDLHRIEIMTLTRQRALSSRLVRGLVLDHGGRHPDMPHQLKQVYILILNVSLEYESTETQAGFVYQTAEQRERLVESERKWLDERCRQIVHFKRTVCTPNNQRTFCIINQKGVDPLCLDIFAKEGILCLRRAKRRNMERLTLACGGRPVLSLQDLQEPSAATTDLLGYAGVVTEVTYGEDKYTFVEDCPAAQSCTLLLQGPHELTVQQIKDAVHDGLRAVKNLIEDGAAVPGAGAFELAASHHLLTEVLPKTEGPAQIGVKIMAEALLVIPKTLAHNAGWDVPATLLHLQQELRQQGYPTGALALGLNVHTGKAMLPAQQGVWDNVRVKRQSLHLCTTLASQLVLVDEIMRAGKAMGGRPGGGGPDEDGAGMA